MKKTFKIVAIAASSLIALLLIAVLVIAVVFNPNDYRGDIERLVNDATGRNLSINDDIELSLFPWIGISTGKVTLDNAAGFGDVKFASIDRAEVKLRLLPLLSRQVEASTVVLHGLQLDLTVADDGTTNWMDLVAEPEGDQRVEATDKQADVASTSASSGKPSAGAGLASLMVDGVQVKDARVTYVDHTSDVRYAIKQLNLQTGPLSLNAPLDVMLSSQFKASEPAINGQIELRAMIKADLGNERYQFDDLTFNATLNGDELPGGQAEIQITSDIALDMPQQTVALSSLKLSGYGLDLSGELNIEQLQSEPTLQGRFSLAEFNPQAVLPAMGVELPKTTDANALSRMQLAFVLSGSMQQYKLEQLVLLLDESRIEGALQLAVSDAPLPAVQYELRIDQLDLDRYLPPVVDEAIAPVVSAVSPAKGASADRVTVATPGGAVAAASTLPMQTLRELDLEGGLNIDQLKLSGLSMSALKTKMHAAQGIIRLHPISAQLYQGEYRGDLKLDARGAQPKISLNESMQNIHVGPLLKDYMDEDKVSGVGSITAKLTAVGETQAAITQSLNGTATIAFADGAIKDFNIVQMVSEAEAKYKKRPVPPASAEMRNTDFAALNASLKIKNGVVSNSDLSIKSPFLRVGGDGQVNLVNESIDYLATIVLSKTKEGQGGKALDDLRGVKLPLRVGGTFSAPTFKPELSDALKALAKEALAKEKAKLKAKAQEKLDKMKADERAALEEKLAAEKARLERKAKEKLKELFGR